MYKNLIFDFDGTVGDTYPIFNAGVQASLTARGFHVDPAETMAALKVTFAHMAECYNHLVPGDTLRAELREYRLAHTEEMIRPCAGLMPLLAAARERGTRCYIYTHSGGEVQKYLQRMGIAEDFVDLMTANENYPLKPDPTALLALCARNNLSIAESLMIGDRDIDVHAGQNAGMHGCLFDPDGFYDPAKVGAEINVSSLDELIAYL